MLMIICHIDFTSSLLSYIMKSSAKANMGLQKSEVRQIKWIASKFKTFQTKFPLSVSDFRMPSLRRTLLLAILASVVLVLALLHSWPTRSYTTVDVWQRPGQIVEKRREDRLPEPDHRLGNIPFHVRDNVARYGLFLSDESVFLRATVLQPNFPPFVCLQLTMQLVGTQWMCVWGREWRNKPALHPALVPTGVCSTFAHCLWGLWAGGNEEETGQRVQEFPKEVSSSLKHKFQIFCLEKQNNKQMSCYL